jgi:hypothetical protein
LNQLKKLVAIIVLLCFYSARAQVRFSIASDLSLMRNFSPQQKFWSLGGTVQANFHFNKKQSAYAWLNYYIPSGFENNFIAAAKSSNTLPSTIPFKASATWKNNEVSLGWKHYLKGSFDTENEWSLYSIAGLGLMFSKIGNVFAPAVDTSLYHTPMPLGDGKFYRLTLDLGMGAEFPIGGNFFLYGDVRTWLPASDYPSPYLHSNKNVPLAVIVSGGMRILFGY